MFFLNLKKNVKYVFSHTGCNWREHKGVHFQLVDSMLFGHVRLAVFFRALSKYFWGQRWLSSPGKKSACTPTGEI